MLKSGEKKSEIPLAWMMMSSITTNKNEQNKINFIDVDVVKPFLRLNPLQFPFNKRENVEKQED